MLSFCRSKVKWDLLDFKNDENIWQEAFWAFQGVLMNCVTINSPVKKLEKPMDAQLFFEFDFSKGDILELFMEVHNKDQSRMNQAWGMDNIFILKSEHGGIWQLFTYKVIQPLIYLMCSFISLSFKPLDTD